MIYLGYLLFLIGVLGLYWMIFGAATISLIYSIVTLKIFNKREIENLNQKIKFEVLLAAYNEEINLPISLNSLSACLPKVEALKESLDFSVYVGLDHCTDGTLNKLNEFKNTSKLPIKYFENSGDRGKWFIIKQLILSSDADWVALMDCGSTWDESLVLKANSFFHEKNLICIAPSYLPAKAKLLETTYWRLEQLLRTVENLSGGSIMVHGPTVFYKRSALLLAVELLSNKHWINDDVAIPLVLRNHNSDFRILYLADLNRSAWVHDHGVVSDVEIELKRRKRILIGNLQCATDLIIPKLNPFKIISYTSSRLLFKILWAYWFTFFAIGSLLIMTKFKDIILFIFPQNFLMISLEIFILAGLVSAFYKSNYLHRLMMAYLSGLQINKGLKALKNPKGIVWS